jgi:hypothetical protein
MSGLASMGGRCPSDFLKLAEAGNVVVSSWPIVVSARI